MSKTTTMSQDDAKQLLEELKNLLGQTTDAEIKAKCRKADQAAIKGDDLIDAAALYASFLQAQAMKDENVLETLAPPKEVRDQLNAPFEIEGPLKALMNSGGNNMLEKVLAHIKEYLGTPLDPRKILLWIYYVISALELQSYQILAIVGLLLADIDLKAKEKEKQEASV